MMEIILKKWNATKNKWTWETMKYEEQHGTQNKERCLRYVI